MLKKPHQNLTSGLTTGAALVFLAQLIILLARSVIHLKLSLLSRSLAVLGHRHGSFFMHRSGGNGSTGWSNQRKAEKDIWNKGQKWPTVYVIQPGPIALKTSAHPHLPRTKLASVRQDAVAHGFFNEVKATLQKSREKHTSVPSTTYLQHLRLEIKREMWWCSLAAIHLAHLYVKTVLCQQLQQTIRSYIPRSYVTTHLHIEIRIARRTMKKKARRTQRIDLGPNPQHFLFR